MELISKFCENLTLSGSFLKKLRRGVDLVSLGQEGDHEGHRQQGDLEREHDDDDEYNVCVVGRAWQTTEKYRGQDMIWGGGHHH